MMSSTRRAFLQGAILGALAPLAGAPLRPAQAMRLEHVIFDARRPQALAFAAAARRLGASAAAIHGQFSGRWFLELRARLSNEALPLAGITDFRSLFFLQTIAADAGLRPILRIHHTMRGEGIAHEAFGAPAYRAICAARLGHDGERWACAAAQLVMSLPLRSGTDPRGNMTEANRRVLDSNTLVTWAMA